MQYLSSKMLEVLEFAARAHKQQLRKNPDGTPYISHPFAVGLILSKAGFNDEVVMAGLLHDVVEDTEVTELELQKKFGDDIAGLVMGVTEDKTLPWAECKEAYNRKLSKQSAEVAAISAADLIANRQSVLLELRKGNNAWLSFSKNPQKYFENIMKFDHQRMQIISQILKDHPLVAELEAAEAETKELTGKLEW